MSHESVESAVCVVSNLSTLLIKKILLDKNPRKWSLFEKFLWWKNWEVLDI